MINWPASSFMIQPAAMGRLRRGAGRARPDPDLAEQALELIRCGAGSLGTALIIGDGDVPDEAGMTRRWPQNHSISAARSRSSPAAMAASASAWRGGWRKPAPTSPSSGAMKRSRPPRPPSSRRGRQGDLGHRRRHRQGRRRRHGRARRVRELGRIDILVNNAGINIRKPPQALDLAEWDSVIRTNLTSAFLCSQAVYPAMKAGRRRQDHQYRLDDVDLRRQLRAGLCREQRRHRAVHPLLRGRLGRRQHPGQCGAAGLDRYRSDQARPRADRRPARQGAGAHAGGAMGRDRPISPASRCFSPPPRPTSSPARRFPSMADFRSWDRCASVRWPFCKRAPERCRRGPQFRLGRERKSPGEKETSPCEIANTHGRSPSRSFDQPCEGEFAGKSTCQARFGGISCTTATSNAQSRHRPQYRRTLLACGLR